MPYNAAYVKAYKERIRQGLHVPRKLGTKKADNIVCDFCNKEFYRPPSNRRTSNQYCSRECMAKAFVGHTSSRQKQPELKDCMSCGKVIARPSWAWKNKDLAFCDRSCFAGWKAKNWIGENNPSWKGGKYYYYGDNWERQAREARRRDAHTCQFCGLKEDNNYRALDVHHIKPFRFYEGDFKRANKLINLISLCPTCHCFLEKLSTDGTIDKWITLKDLGVKRFLAKERADRVDLTWNQRVEQFLLLD